MTVYSGGIVAAQKYLATVVTAAGPDIENAPIATRLSIVEASGPLR